MLRWLWRGGGGHTMPMAGVMVGVFDELYNPGAVRAHDELRAQHERVLPCPSPGDRMLTEGRVRITRSKKATSE